MPTSFRLTAVARDGSSQVWDAESEQDVTAQEWTYRVTVAGCLDFYEARFKEVGPDLIQPDVLDRHHTAFRGKGLAEALFARVVVDSGRTLVSSTNNGAKNFPNEYRSQDAERLWRYLFAEERAEYDESADRFRYYPEGLPARGIVRRAGAPRRPRFYVKGSYVLDVLFGTNYANDIDICWLDSGGQPTNARVAAWMRLCRLPWKPIQLVRVRDFFACDGGGAPVFNIDLWRIEMDGCAYDMNPATHGAIKMPAPPQTRLGFLPSPPPFALTPSAQTNAMLDKARAKMARHPSLFDQTTETEILRLKARPIP